MHEINVITLEFLQQYIYILQHDDALRYKLLFLKLSTI